MAPHLPLFLKDQFYRQKLPAPWFRNVFREDQLSHRADQYFSFAEDIDQLSVLIDMDDGASKIIQSSEEIDQARANLKQKIVDANPSPLCNLLPVDDEEFADQTSISLETCLQDMLESGQNAANLHKESRRWCVYFLPPYLTLHLSRSTYHTFREAEKGYNSASNQYVQYKVQTKVKYPLYNLDMNPFVCSENPNNEYIYDLVGVCCHSGRADNGHYYAFCRDREEGGAVSWWKFSDESVMQVKEADVVTMKACMLVYEQKGKAQYSMTQIKEMVKQLRTQ